MAIQHLKNKQKPHKTNDFSLIETIKTEVKIENYKITELHQHIYMYFPITIRIIYS